jgi:hypothetical protein
MVIFWWLGFRLANVDSGFGESAFYLKELVISRLWQHSTIHRQGKFMAVFSRFPEHINCVSGPRLL